MSPLGDQVRALVLGLVDQQASPDRWWQERLSTVLADLEALEARLAAARYAREQLEAQVLRIEATATRALDEVARLLDERGPVCTCGADTFDFNCPRHGSYNFPEKS
jgi:hypothetical protein